MRQSSGAMFAAALVALLSGNLRANPTPPLPHVIVRVFDFTGQPSSGLQAALDEAGGLMPRTAFVIDWRICQGAPPAAQCSSPMQTRELILRIFTARSRRGAPGRIRLGDAALDSVTGAGVLATIYLLPIAQMASQGSFDPGTLEGRAIAHELGHLLLGTNAHSEVGLMRAVWTVEELRLDHRNDWKFSEREAAAMRLSASQAMQTARQQ